MNAAFPAAPPIFVDAPRQSWVRNLHQQLDDVRYSDFNVPPRLLRDSIPHCMQVGCSTGAEVLMAIRPLTRSIDATLGTGSLRRHNAEASWTQQALTWVKSIAEHAGGILGLAPKVIGYLVGVAVGVALGLFEPEDNTQQAARFLISYIGIDDEAAANALNLYPEAGVIPVEGRLPFEVAVERGTDGLVKQLHDIMVRACLLGDPRVPEEVMHQSVRAGIAAATANRPALLPYFLDTAWEVNLLSYSPALQDFWRDHATSSTPLSDCIQFTTAALAPVLPADPFPEVLTHALCRQAIPVLRGLLVNYYGNDADQALSPAEKMSRDALEAVVARRRQADPGKTVRLERLVQYVEAMR